MAYADTKSVFEAVAPDLFEQLDDSLLETYIELALKRLTLDQWGDRFRQAVAYLAAHYAELAQNRSGQPGALVSEKAGKVSRSYANQGQSERLETTVYGEQFVELRDELPTLSPMTAYGSYPDYANE